MTKPKARTTTLGVTLPAVIGHPNDVGPEAWADHPHNAGPLLEGPSVGDLIEDRRGLASPMPDAQVEAIADELDAREFPDVYTDASYRIKPLPRDPKLLKAAPELDDDA